MAIGELPDLLMLKGPSLTTELIDHWISEGVSSAAARQRLARGLASSGPAITRLAGLRFQHNARFIFRDDQFGDRRFWDALERVFAGYAPSYAGAVSALKARGGSVPAWLFAAVAGAPLARQRQLSPARILERLRAIQLLTETTDEDDVQYVSFLPFHYAPDPPHVVRAHLLAENVALEGLRNWVRRMGLGSYEQVRIRGEGKQPEVSSLVWDLSAPSYARPLVGRSAKGLRPGFIVLDINLRHLDAPAVASFVRKHDMASAPPGVAPIMPFLIADSFTQAGFGLARQKGVIATTIEHLLGIEVAKALRDLISLLTDMGATAAVNPEHLQRVFGTLTRIQGASDNLRGPLLELAVAYLVKEVEKGSIEVGKKVRHPTSGRSAEMDVMLLRPEGSGVLVIECKAKGPGTRLTLDIVQKWMIDRVPLICECLRFQSRFAQQPLRFELWTNAPIDPEAFLWLKQNSQRYPDCEVGWRDGGAMKQYAKRAKSAAITAILNEHFFLHPLVAKPKGKVA